MTTLVMDAIERCCLGTIGSIRTVTAGTVERDAYGAIADFTLAQRVRVKARFEVELVSATRTGHIAPATANRAILEVVVRIVLALTTETEVAADDRRDVRRDALGLWETIRQALTWPGNLSTVDATATLIVSGCLRKCGPARVTREDWPKRIFRLEAEGVALVEQAQVVS